MQITPEQIRAARALLRLEQADLARRALVSVITVRRVESAAGPLGATPSARAITRALTEAGAEFIPGGVRRRADARSDADRLFEDLRAISLRSAARLDGEALLTEADLYDADGLPA